MSVDSERQEQERGSHSGYTEDLFPLPSIFGYLFYFQYIYDVLAISSQTAHSRQDWESSGKDWESNDSIDR